MEQAQHQLLWAQPEIILYDTLRDTHPGYPDIIQDPTDARRIVITETQKTIARLHEIPHGILKALETQHSVRTLAPASGAKRTYSTEPVSVSCHSPGSHSSTRLFLTSISLSHLCYLYSCDDINRPTRRSRHHCAEEGQCEDAEDAQFRQLQCDCDSAHG